MAAPIQACFKVKTRDETEVAQEFATSLRDWLEPLKRKDKADLLCYNGSWRTSASSVGGAVAQVTNLQCNLQPIQGQTMIGSRIKVFTSIQCGKHCADSKNVVVLMELDEAQPCELTTLSSAASHSLSAF